MSILSLMLISECGRLNIHLEGETTLISKDNKANCGLGSMPIHRRFMSRQNTKVQNRDSSLKNQTIFLMKPQKPHFIQH